jgi:cytochrome c peroxidase
MLPRKVVLFLVVSLVGCQPARQYGPLLENKPGSAPPPAKVEPLPAHYSWLAPRETRDIPIRFVAGGSSEWASLPTFWNPFPPLIAGSRTLHLGQHPLGMATSLVLADQVEVIKIKVPLGLPDPGSHIPSANPPTLGKWKLGKLIFFDPRLLTGGKDGLACASCHRPRRGFSQQTVQEVLNPPTLINCVFNKHQFWDGRATYLEEVLVRQLEDERISTKENTDASRRHIWGGLVTTLDRDPADPKYPAYRQLFSQVFGVPKPTQDTIAKALATYMRTILSGDSLLDRAWQEKERSQATFLSAAHFAPFLTEATVVRLEQPRGRDRKDLARLLERGHGVFQRSGCGQCHPAPLFTDHDFHNIGLGESQEPGRFAQVPIGLKEARFMGAFRTPTLRALPRTPPYFHDGTRASLQEVVEYFDHELPFHPSLALPLRVGENQAKALHLTEESLESLVLYLHALDGEPVDPIIAVPPKPFE